MPLLTRALIKTAMLCLALALALGIALALGAGNAFFFPVVFPALAVEKIAEVVVASRFASSSGRFCPNR
ncbi:MAG: hypothetical protein Fur0016_17370 [Anaerolineales bacterium]